MKRDVPGFAVGGLSGGEAKEQFWRSYLTVRYFNFEQSNFSWRLLFNQIERKQDKMTNECRMVAVSAASLPPTAPRYLMGVGHQVALFDTF